MILVIFMYDSPVFVMKIDSCSGEEQERISEDAAQFEDHYLQMR